MEVCQATNVFVVLHVTPNQQQQQSIKGIRKPLNKHSGLLSLVVEPLNKGHIGIRSTVPCSTVEPLNKGHIGIRSTVPCSTVEPLNKGHIGIRSTVPCSTVEPLNKGHIGIRSTY